MGRSKGKETSGGLCVMSAEADIYKCSSDLSMWGLKAGERKDMLCICSLSRCLFHSNALETHGGRVAVQRRPAYSHTHTHLLSQHEHKNTIKKKTKKTKMASYVSYILVSNKRKKKVVQTGRLLTQTKHLISHSVIQTHSPKNIHFSN